jgi:hypothetical protein
MVFSTMSSTANAFVFDALLGLIRIKRSIAQLNIC